MKFQILIPFSIYLQHALAGVIHGERSLKSLPLPNKLIHQFPLPTWIESVAVRPNDNLLLTHLTSPSLSSLDPSSTVPELVYTFPNATGVFGITEVLPDVFVTIAGIFDLATATSTPGTSSIWIVDYTSKSVGAAQPKITKLLDLKEANFLNGITPLPSQPGTVLIADSILGLVWKLNIFTKKYSIVIKDLVELAPVASASPQIGINGLHVSKDNKQLYWTNSNTKSLYRASITSSGNLISGASSKIEILATDKVFFDDFALDEGRGLAFAATNLGNTVVAVDISGKNKGKAVTVVGSIGDLTVAGDTALAFGRGAKDRHVLYVVTGGALAAPVNGTIVEGGKIVAVNTKGFSL